MATNGKTLKPGKLAKEWINRVRKVCGQVPGLQVAALDGGQVWGRPA